MRAEPENYGPCKIGTVTLDWRRVSHDCEFPSLLRFSTYRKAWIFFYGSGGTHEIFIQNGEIHFQIYNHSQELNVSLGRFLEVFPEQTQRTLYLLAARPWEGLGELLEALLKAVGYYPSFGTFAVQTRSC